MGQNLAKCKNRQRLHNNDGSVTRKGGGKRGSYVSQTSPRNNEFSSKKEDILNDKEGGSEDKSTQDTTVNMSSNSNIPGENKKMSKNNENSPVQNGNEKMKKHADDPDDTIACAYTLEDMPSLTSRQIDILNKSWAFAKNKMDEIGHSTFLKLFEHHPETQEVYAKFSELNDMNLQYSNLLRQHGARVIALIDRVVDKLLDRQAFWDEIMQVGRHHYDYGALPIYFDLMGPHFVVSMHQCIKDEFEWNEEVDKTYLDLFNCVTYVMKAGFDVERCEKKMNSPTRRLSKNTKVFSGTPDKDLQRRRARRELKAKMATNKKAFLTIFERSNEAAGENNKPRTVTPNLRIDEEYEDF